LSFNKHRFEILMNILNLFWVQTIGLSVDKTFDCMKLIHCYEFRNLVIIIYCPYI